MNMGIHEDFYLFFRTCGLVQPICQIMAPLDQRRNYLRRMYRQKSGTQDHIFRSFELAGMSIEILKQNLMNFLNQRILEILDNFPAKKA